MNTKLLKAAVTELNEAGIEGLAKIKMIGIKTSTLTELYLSGVEYAADNGHENSLSENIVAVYNELVKEAGEATEGSDTAEEPKENPADDTDVKPKKEKAAKKEKAPKAPKAKKEPAAKKELSRYGHIQSAGSGKIDDLVFAGNTVKAMMEETGFPRTRIVGHIKHLINDKGVKVKETKPSGDDTKLNDIHYQAEQERI